MSSGTALTLPAPAEPTAVFVGRSARDLAPARPNEVGWVRDGVQVTVQPVGPTAAEIGVTAVGEVSYVVLRWSVDLPDSVLVLGDAWERSYGDLQWRPPQPERLLPWYWLAHELRTGTTTGLGVDVGPAAMCGWTVDRDGISLWLDLRNGGAPTVLAGRTLTAARVRAFDDAGSPWTTLDAAVAEMAGELPTRREVGPVVGANNWYYAYGQDFDVAAVLTDARTVVELADGHPVRPFSVIDDGWNTGGASRGGPWDAGIPGVFDSMADTADRIRACGARPGLWFRPLLTRDPAAEAYARGGQDGSFVLDVSTPAALDQIRTDLTRFAGWGYELVKHDFSTFDVLGRFGPAMTAELTRPGWAFADRSRTTAEIVLDFYRCVRGAAGELVIIGCNTIGHLCAGLVDVQRTGDDTSGRTWERTRRMGVNSLAFRLPQHDRFFTVDADCVPVTAATPWPLNAQFLDLIARSGTALFVSIDPAARTDRTDADVAAALRTALNGGEDGLEPLDWLGTTAPTRWRTTTTEITCSWSEPFGAIPGDV